MKFTFQYQEIRDENEKNDISVRNPYKQEP